MEVTGGGGVLKASFHIERSSYYSVSTLYVSIPTLDRLLLGVTASCFEVLHSVVSVPGPCLCKETLTKLSHPVANCCELAVSRCGSAFSRILLRNH